MKHSSQLAALAALVALTGSAAAEGNPYYLGASQSFTRDSNVTRVTDGPDKVGDTISSTGLRAGVDQSFGRQRLNLAVSVNRNQFSNQKQFNNTDHDLSAQLNWATIERLSGVLSASTRESLYRNNDRGTAVTTRNLLRNDAVSLQARLGVVTDLSFDGGLAASRNQYSDPAYAANNLRQHSINGGVRWSPVDIWSVRLGLRRTDGRYVNINDDITRDDIDLSGTFNASGASDINTRLSYTKLRHSLISQRNSRGWTGLASWGWRPTGKLRFNTSFVRDNDVGASDLKFGLGTLTSSDARRTTTLSTQAAWEVAAKVNVNGGLSWSRQALDNVFSGIGGSTSTVRTTALNLGVSYQVLRNLDLGCTVSREDHRASTTVGTYDVTVYGCSGQIYLR